MSFENIVTISHFVAMKGNLYSTQATFMIKYMSCNYGLPKKFVCVELLSHKFR